MSAAKLQLNSPCLCLLTLSGILLGLGPGTDGEKVVVTEGEDAVLPCSLSTKENIELKLFDWRKSAQKDERQKEVFMYDAGVHYNNGRGGQSDQFKGRVSHFIEELKHGNASITIRNTSFADSGNYTCDFPRLQPRQTFQIQLVVGAPAEPFVWIADPTELGLQLQCDVKGAFPKPEVQWEDGAGNLLQSDESVVTGSGGHYDVTLKTTVTKPGDFHCVSRQQEISHSGRAEITLPVAHAKPSISKRTEPGLQLQCDVTGAFPKPEVQWEDGVGNVLQSDESVVTGRAGHYNISLKTTVNEAGYFRCVARQEEISYRNSTGINLHEELFKEKCKRQTIISILGGLTLGALIVPAVLAVLVKRKYVTIHLNKGQTQRKDPAEMAMNPVVMYHAPSSCDVLESSS